MDNRRVAQELVKLAKELDGAGNVVKGPKVAGTEREYQVTSSNIYFQVMTGVVIPVGGVVGLITKHIDEAAERIEKDGKKYAKLLERRTGENVSISHYASVKEFHQRGNSVDFVLVFGGSAPLDPIVIQELDVMGFIQT